MSIGDAIVIAWDVFKSVVAPIKRQFGYVTSSNSYAQDLQNKVDELAYKAEMVQDAVEVATNNSRNIYSYVTQWQADAEKALNEARGLLGDFGMATCCYGSLPEPSCRYQFSRLARDKIEGIQLLAQQHSQIRDISFIDLAPWNVTRREDNIFKSRELVMQEIMVALADNSNSVVGIYGMGGVGKSTLLADAERRIREEKSFDWVTKADVSENQDIKRIQIEIALGLGLTDIRNEEYASGRAKLLGTRLENLAREKKKVLIILDNLWEELDLKAVGIPCRHDNKAIKCKLLLTSRSRDILRRKMICDRDFHLEELKEEEAKCLFERMVGDKVHVDPFKSLMDEALRKCAGLPFLIIAMAKIFKDANDRQWKDALKQIEMYTNIGLSETINKTLQLSYDSFEGKEGKQVKSLLRLCVVYGVSKPSLENLVRYSMGLRLFEEIDKIEDARDRLSSLIHTLQASSLLLDNEDDDGFKIHDLVRGFVASIASREEPLLVWKDNDESVMELPKDKLKSCTALCFPYVEIKQLPEELDCPETQIFLLFSNDDSLKIPDSYFNSMRKLMVLHLSQVCLTHSPSPFKLLEDLHTLCLDGCSLEDVAMIGELKGLHILSFVNSNIHRLPKEIGQLVELRLLDLSECSQLEIIEPGVLGSLMKLEELYMWNSFDKWNAMEQTPPTNAELIELGNKKNLHTLHVSIPDLRMLPEDLNVKKLTKYNIQIGGACCYEPYKGSSVLELKLHSISDSLQKGCIQTLLGKTDHLLLDGSNGIESICSLSHEGFQKLKHLYVEYSPSGSNNQVGSQVAFFDRQEVAFPSLETLKISNMDNIEILWDNQVAADSFHKLKSLDVWSCNKLLNIVPSCILGRLKSLESLEVRTCDLLEVVFKLQPLNSLDGHLVADLPLKRLELYRLPELKCVWDKELHSQVKFQCLRSITVFECKSLTSLFPASVVVHLTQLEELEIDKCGIVELIKKEDKGVPRFVFPKLTSLKLQHLTELRCICIRKYVSHWPALKTLEMYDYHKVEILASHPENDMPFDKQPLFLVEKVLIPSLESLTMDGLPNLENLWTDESPLELSNLQFLKLSSCKSLSKVINSRSLTKLHKLHTLEVEDCISMQEIFDLDELGAGANIETLSELNTIDIYGLPSLRRIWNKNPCGIVRFHNLKKLKVWSCENLRFLFFPSMVQSLAQLRELDVRYCENMEAIIMEEEQLIIETLEILVFPMLTKLYLETLESLTCFSHRKCTPKAQGEDSIKLHSPLLFNQEVAFPSLETLKISNMDNIEILWDNQVAADSFHKLKSLDVWSCNKLELYRLPELKCVWDKELHSQVKFQCLRSITFYECKSLTSLFPASVVVHLTQLEELEIYECGIVELIKKEDKGVPRFVFPKLTSLKLQHLMELRCICIGKYVSHWPALKTLEMYDCHKVEILASHPENDMPFDKQPLFLVEKVAFPSLETLEIRNMDNIEILWDNQVAADSFHKLKSLDVWSCNKLELYRLPELKCVWDKELHSQVKFQCLRSITFYECKSLTSLFPASVVVHLTQLEELEVQSCDSLEVVFKLQPLNPLDGHHVADFPLERLKLDGLPKLKCVWDKELHSQVKFQCLRFVTVSGCKSLTSLFPASVAIHLTQLEELEISECGIVELIEKEGPVLKVVFPRLTFLKLKDLIDLKCIYTGVHASCWPGLKNLEVQGCNKVEILASQLENEMPLRKQPLFLIEKGAFPNLQELKLDLSGQMEIWHGHFHDGEFFSKLRVLELHHFSKEFTISTRCFLQSLANLEKLLVCESYQEKLSINMEAIAGPSHEPEVILPFSFQHLKTLEMSNCDGLSPYIILPFSGYFQHLKTLDMSFCDGLSNIFTLTIARNLVELTKLRIINCEMLTEVICDKEGEEGLVVAFNQLKYIELDGLTRLRCFSSIEYTLMFPLLEDVIVSGCPRMKFFSRGPIEAPKLETVQVSTRRTKMWFWKENLDITIQNMFEEMEMVSRLEFIQLSEFPKLIEKWHGELNPIKLSWQLKSLMVDKCPSFINAIPSKLMLLLVNITRLQICDCESLEEIFDLEGLVSLESTQMIPSSMTLDLVNLPKLRQLWNKDLQGLLPYNFLSYITLYNCSNLRHAFNPSMAQCLANLSKVEIRECDWMEGVIEEEEGQQSILEKITFPNLEKVKLECLPNLTSFLLGKNILECPNLIELTIAHCPKMSSLTGQPLLEIDHLSPSLFTPQVQFPRLKLMVLSHIDDLSKIWTNDPKDTLTFEHLQEVKIDNCKSLENVFPHWVATSLTQLKELQVESCGLKEVVTSGDDTSHSTTAQFLFPQLTSLVFHDMSQLKSFCPNLLTLNWPLLMELQVTHCDKLDMSFVASMNKGAQRDDQHDLSDHEADFLLEGGIPTLERLLLVDKDIQRIHDGKFSDDFFGKPKALTLACFHDENVVFPPIFLLQRFQNLQSLEIFCSSFEDIFPDEGLVDEGKRPVLENLEELKLRKLPNLKHVWREGYLVAKILQSIGKFEVCDCPRLTTLFPAMTSFRNMTKLVVKNSSGLMHLVTVSVITNLVHLSDMTIIGCERMKEVVANDGNGEGKVISLGKLRWLTLQNLSSLECFSSTTSCIFKFPSMYSIKVEECPKMKIFCEGALSTPKLHLATLFRYKWQGDWEGDLNTTIQKLTT